MKYSATAICCDATEALAQSFSYASLPHDQVSHWL